MSDGEKPHLKNTLARDDSTVWNFKDHTEPRDYSIHPRDEEKRIAAIRQAIENTRNGPLDPVTKAQILANLKSQLPEE